MYYVIAEQEIHSLAGIRKIITVANKKFFADLCDDFPLARPRYTFMDEEVFDEIIKDGYKTEKAAKNDKNVRKELYDFIGPFAIINFKVISEENLIKLYHHVKSLNHL